MSMAKDYGWGIDDDYPKQPEELIDNDNKQEGRIMPDNKFTLKSITVGGDKLPPRIVAYGTDGIGKSTFGSQANKPIFICTEDGASRLDVPQFPVCKTWTEIFDCCRILAKEQHEFKTVVLDTADWAQNLAVAHIIETTYKGDGEKFDAYGAGFKVLMREFRKLIAALDYLNGTKKMEIIMLLHATIKTFKNPLGDDYDIYKASLVDTPSTSIWGLTKEWADLVLFMNNKVMVKTASASATKGKAKMSQKRMIYSKPSAAYDAKVRAGWNLPDEFELDYPIFKAHLNKKVKKTKGKENDTTV